MTLTDEPWPGPAESPELPWDFEHGMQHEIVGDDYKVGSTLPGILRHTYVFRTRLEWLPEDFKTRFNAPSHWAWQPTEVFPAHTFFGVPILTRLESIMMDYPTSGRLGYAYAYTLTLEGAEEIR